MKVADSLQAIIGDMDNQINLFSEENYRLNQEIESEHEALRIQSVDLQTLRDKKIPWYRHPLTIAILGFAGGIWVAK